MQDRPIHPMDEIEMMDRWIHEAGVREEARCFHPEFPPKRPHRGEEAVTDKAGRGVVDVQRDSGRADAPFTLSMQELRDVDVV